MGLLGRFSRHKVTPGMPRQGPVLDCGARGHLSAHPEPRRSPRPRAAPAQGLASSPDTLPSESACSWQPWAVRGAGTTSSRKPSWDSTARVIGFPTVGSRLELPAPTMPQSTTGTLALSPGVGTEAAGLVLSHPVPLFPAWASDVLCGTDTLAPCSQVPCSGPALPPATKMGPRLPISNPCSMTTTLPLETVSENEASDSQKPYRKGPAVPARVGLFTVHCGPVPAGALPGRGPL